MKTIINYFKVTAISTPEAMLLLKPNAFYIYIGVNETTEKFSVNFYLNNFIKDLDTSLS